MTGLLIAVFLSVSVLAGAIAWIVLARSNVANRRLLKRINALSERDGRQAKAAVKLVRDDPKDILVNKIARTGGLQRKLEKLLNQAGSPMKADALIRQMLLLAAGGVLVSLVMQNALLKVILVAGMPAIPILQLQMKKVQRLRAFIREFPDALDMMTSAIRAGHALNQAVQLVGNEAPDPVGVEFKKTFEQYNLGLNLKDSLLNLTERVDSLDLKLFVTAVLLQRETGGNLNEMLENISYTIRERFKLIGQIRTYTAQGRMSAWILGLLPVIFVVIVSLLNPGYLKPLFTDPLGNMLLGMAVVSQITGFIWIQKIIKIRYQ
ncbi:type II secretion system F family protein [bacterium]|nr:type II secretion system F family protein [bacterium]